MEDKKCLVVVVCGYGCNINSPLRLYLDRVWRYLDQWRPDVVIYSGGYTQQKSFPVMSEARVMSDFVNSVIPIWIHQQHHDVNAYTTYENIEHSAQFIQEMMSSWPVQKGQEGVEITIFCETQRALKVILLARHFMRGCVSDVDDIMVETFNWERASPDRELWATLKTRLAISFPFMARRESEKQKRLSKNR